MTEAQRQMNDMIDGLKDAEAAAWQAYAVARAQFGDESQRTAMVYNGWLNTLHDLLEATSPVMKAAAALRGVAHRKPSAKRKGTADA